jgi:hypothetical protein
MTRIEPYLRYQDVFETPSTFEQFEAELRSLDRTRQRNRTFYW